MGSILVVGSPGVSLEGTSGGQLPSGHMARELTDTDRVTVLSLPGPGLLVSAMAATSLSLRRLLQGALADLVEV
ncbi:MAG: hypothetical protein DLM54_02315 [Acidimicrobiales bacterium]|nr:MAG: hypothetical protein DLM54_02315 [Acidimicrobiales bacterium]